MNIDSLQGHSESLPGAGSSVGFGVSDEEFRNLVDVSAEATGQTPDTISYEHLIRLRRYSSDQMEAIAAATHTDLSSGNRLRVLLATVEIRPRPLHEGRYIKLRSDRAPECLRKWDNRSKAVGSMRSMKLHLDRLACVAIKRGMNR